MTEFLTLSVAGAEVHLDPKIGNIRGLKFQSDGRSVAPLHTAPWVDDPDVQADHRIPMVERKLSGDFFCAPFSVSDLETNPIHGWTANGPWEVDEIVQNGRFATARMVLGRPVMGARVIKEVRIEADAPILYQTHHISDGADGLTVAHHPMVQMAGAGRLSFSPKRLALTTGSEPVAGRNWLAYPAEGSDLAAFPGAQGTVDLHHYPTGAGNDDFITLIEAEGNKLGWTAIMREAEDDIVFVLKDPKVLPVTMLWYSNGGRDHAPWNGRHIGVLGVEDGCTAGAEGHSAAQSANAVAAAGVRSALRLGSLTTHVIRHALGAVPRPEGWNAVVDIQIDGHRLVLLSDTGARLLVPFKAGFLRS